MSPPRSSRTRRLVTAGFGGAVLCVTVAGLVGASGSSRDGEALSVVDGPAPDERESPLSPFEMLSPLSRPGDTPDDSPEPAPGPVVAPATPSTRVVPERVELSLPPPPLAPEETPPSIETGPTQADLEVLLNELVADIEGQSPGVVASISVSAGQLEAGVAADTSFVAASVAKLYWTVAAVDAVGLEPVEAHAEAVFGWSDNDAAGLMIDVVGVDAINAYTRGLGLDRTYLSSWAYGKDRYATDRSTRGTNNTTSTGDLVSFLEQLATGQLLNTEATATVLGWMTAAPDRLSATHPYAAALVDALPAISAAFASHKAGWLPSGCCTLIDNVLTAAGLIPLADGSTLTIAIAVADGAEYDAQVQWTGEATCRVWVLLSEADHVDCRKTESFASL